jgi:integrase/recombinase XerD
MTAHTTATAAAADLALADLAGSWMIDLARRTAPGTRRAYSTGITAFIAWHAAQAPGMPVTAASLDRKTAAAFLSDVLAAGAAPATARLRYQALRQFSAWLAEEGETAADLLLGMKPPRLDKPRVDSLDPGELAALIRACRVPAGADRWEAFEVLRDEAVVRLLADTGMRAGELLALTTGDLDLRRRLVTVTRAKGGKHRIAAFGPDAARAVDRYLRRGRRGHKLAHTPPLWLGTANRGWTYPALRGALAKRAAAAGITGFHPHRLRHTAASAALDAGMAEGDVMAHMGWSSRQMLDRYVEDTAQRRAAENFQRYLDGRGR